jgi:hypothetical protein
VLRIALPKAESTGVPCLQAGSDYRRRELDRAVPAQGCRARGEVFIGAGLYAQPAYVVVTLSYCHDSIGVLSGSSHASERREVALSYESVQYRKLVPVLRRQIVRTVHHFEVSTDLVGT